MHQRRTIMMSFRTSDTESAASSGEGRHRRVQIKFFTIPEVAERLGVCARTVRRWISAGDLIVHRVGHVVRIAEGDLRAFLAAHRGEEP
jgi:excisionase family DNA binding protein